AAKTAAIPSAAKTAAITRLAVTTAIESAAIARLAVAAETAVLSRSPITGDQDQPQGQRARARQPPAQGELAHDLSSEAKSAFLVPVRLPVSRPWAAWFETCGGSRIVFTLRGDPPSLPDSTGRTWPPRHLGSRVAVSQLFRARTADVGLAAQEVENVQ